MVVNTAAVVRLTDLTVRLALCLRRRYRCVNYRRLLRRRLVALLADKVRERRRRRRYVILT